MRRPRKEEDPADCRVRGGVAAAVSAARAREAAVQVSGSSLLIPRTSRSFALVETEDLRTS